MLEGFEVLDACHRKTLLALDQLAELATGLERDAIDAPLRATAAAVVQFFATTSRQHHQDEELHVFPQLLASGDAELVQHILRLQQDHGWLEQDWLELEPQLQALAAGQSWVDPATLREGVEIFAALLPDHIALEESCIYPHARVRLRAADRREMGREMAARRRASPGVIAVSR